MSVLAVCLSATWAATALAQAAPPPQTFVADIGAAPLRAPLTADFSPGATFTMEGWFYLNARTPFSWLMGKGLATTGDDPYLSFSLLLDPSGSQLNFSTTTGAAGSKRDITSPTVFPLKTWTHVAAVLDNGVMRLLINGTEVATGTAAGTPLFAPNVPLGIGIAYMADGSTYFRGFPGYARQVRFWNVARTAAQIAAAMTESLPGDATGLVAAWPLDESSGTTARDISGASRALSTSGIVAVQSSVLAAGPFFAEQTPTPVVLQFFTNSVLTDFDSDGDKDLVVFDVSPSTIPETRTPVRAYRNDAGNFTEVTGSVLGNVTMVGPNYPIVADFNGDALPDLFVADFGTDHIPWPGGQAKILIRTPGGQLVDESATRLPQHPCNTHSTTAADIDGDGDLDIYMGNIGGSAPNGGPLILLNDSQGNFAEATDRLPADIANRESNHVYTGSHLVDVNGDGFPDLVLGGTQNEMLMNDGTGHFVRDPQFVLPPRLFSGVALTTSIESADFNGDGKPDLLLATTGGSHQMPDGSITVGYSAARLQLLLNRGDGTFTDATPTAGFTWTADEYWVIRPRIIDINGDGHPDIFPEVGMAPPRTAGARIFLNRGNGQFVDATAAYRVPSDAGYVDAADFDLDGRIDLITATQTAITSARNIQPLSLEVFSLGNQPPAFTEQPESRTVGVGSACTFMVAVSGYPAPAFQWRKNGVDIVGATSGTYTVTQAIPDDAGIYTVVATNASGSVSSAGAVLTVFAPPAQPYVAAIGTSPLKAPATVAFAPGDAFTMEGWIYLPAISTTYAHLMGKTFDPANTDPYQSFALQLTPGNTIALNISDGTPGSFRYLPHPTVIPARTWTHVAAVAGGGLIKIYVNGVLGGMNPSPGAPPNQPDVPFALGLAYYANGTTNNIPFPGYARQVRFWNVARTAEQIQAAVGEALPTNAAGLVAAWPLDESSGTTARDISGHGYALTVASGAIASVRTAFIDAQPFFASTTTAVTDGSLTYLRDAQLIDFDSDGDQDLVIWQIGPPLDPNTNPPNLQPLRAFRNVNGIMVEATATVLGTINMIWPRHSYVGDFNGDGKADLLIADTGTDLWPLPGGQTKLLIQSNDGRLLDETAIRLPQHSAYTHSITAGDIDGDGDLDIYMGNTNGGDPAIGPRFYINNGSGYFTDDTARIPADISNRDFNQIYLWCLLQDVNGDTHPDLVLGGWNGAPINAILVNDGTGHFVRDANYVLPPKLFGANGQTTDITSGDFNGDGKPDLIMTTTDQYTAAGMQILLNHGNGLFTDETATSGIAWTNQDKSVIWSRILDFNGDGRLDIIATVSVTDSYGAYAGTKPRIFLNVGDAHSIQFVDASAAYATPGGFPVAFLASDYDLDGKIDLMAVSNSAVIVDRSLKLLNPGLFVDVTAPVITAHPGSQSVPGGADVTLSVTATGEFLTYQWYLDGLTIGGASSSSYAISAMQAVNVGSYTVVVRNAAGSITSNAAMLELALTGYAAWRQSNFTADELNQPDKSGPGAVYANDGWTNLLKYALGLEPKQPVTTGLPVVGTTATEWYFDYTRPADRADLAYAVEVSTNLVNWSSSGVSHTRTAIGATETWRATVSLGSPNVYFRLKITQL